uniref:Uncharacterized protein n=1 Tax=Magallana gigas TaxID=29159 RepID=A0A8W8NKT4_MAGGI
MEEAGTSFQSLVCAGRCFWTFVFESPVLHSPTSRQTTGNSGTFRSNPGTGRAVHSTSDPTGWGRNQNGRRSFGQFKCLEIVKL